MLADDEADEINHTKIYWEEFPIAKLSPGKDYLKPDISLIVDDIIETLDKKKLHDFLENWIEYRPLTTVEDGINNLFIGISLFIRNFNFQIFSIPVLIPLPKLTPDQDLFSLG